MNTKTKNFRAHVDTGESTFVLLADADKVDLAEELAETDPPILAGLKQENVSSKDFKQNLTGRLPKKGFTVTSLNAEKYSRISNMKEELLLDLTERAASKTRAARIKRGVRRAQKPPIHRTARFFARLALCVLGALITFAGVLGIVKLLSQYSFMSYLAPSDITLAFWAAAFVGGLSAVLFAAASFCGKTIPLRDRERLLQKTLLTGRNRRTRHVVIVENAVRLSHYEQLTMFNLLSSLTDFNPLTFVLLLSGQALDNFKVYFANCLTGIAIPAGSYMLEEVKAPTPAIRAILSAGQEQPQLHEAERGGIPQRPAQSAIPPAHAEQVLPRREKFEELTGTQRKAGIAATPAPAMVADSEKPARIGETVPRKQLVSKFNRNEEADAESGSNATDGQLDMLENIPAAQANLESFNFAEASTKDILRAFANGELNGIAPADILYGALPKINRMPEKTLNEYLTVLSYTVKNVDFAGIDLSRIENRIWNKFIGWYQGANEEQSILALYERAVKQNNAEIIEAFFPNLSEERRAELAATIRQFAENCYTNNLSFNSIVPVIGLLADSTAPVKSNLLSAVAVFSKNEKLLIGKDAFCFSFALAVNALENQIADEELTAVYGFINMLLAFFEDNLTITAGMRMIAAYKEKFRFHGLSIESLNDVIFNKNFTNVESKLEYIDNLLQSPSLSDTEKNRYISYLSGTRDALEPKHRLRVMQSLMKSGVKVERENILEAVKWIRDDKKQDFLDGLIRLVHTYANLKGAKNDDIFLDIAGQSLSVSERSRIFKAYFNSGFQDTARAVKLLLSAMEQPDETLTALDFVSVVLESLSVLTVSSKLPKNEFVQAVGSVLESEEDLERFKAVLRTLALQYARLSLNGDQKSDLKSAMFKGAAKFEGVDLSVETSVILKVFKIEYISFVEQKIAKQGDPDVEKKVKLALEIMQKQRE